MTEQLLLHNKVALITGAGSGIGFATAELFLKNGSKGVVIADVKIDIARQKLESYNQSKILFVETDVSKEEAISAACQEALTKFGQLDIGVFVAGIFPSPPGSWLEMEVADFDRVNSVNLRGAWLSAKHVVKTMLASPEKGKGGALVFVASASALMGNPFISSYVASKWGVRGLSLVASQEFAPLGIRSNAICPGFTNTGMLAGTPPAVYAELEAGNLLKRVAEPIEMAESILFLASPKSAYTTGATLAVHAGLCPT